MSTRINNFGPLQTKTIAFAASAASANTQFTTTSTMDSVAKIPTTIEIYNATSVIVFVAWGTDNTVAATVANSYPVGPGIDKVIDIPATATWVAVIPLSSVTGSVYISRGYGS